MISYKTRIYYDDTDAGGVVYYANYLKLCERAKQEFFLQNGIDLFKLHNEGVLLVVSRVNAYYKKPIYLGEYVEVDVEASEVKNASLTLKFNLLVNKEIRATVDILSALIKDSKPIKLPQSIRQLYGK
ncbi:MAG: acyl-CoA thioesterase [Desulfurella sp.]|uniref:Acyl-CoA thioester hydrolase n=1 Tax=Desulfurella multipotens TaxID=79269 RepID=A0A1G6QTC1_9BACT|nr:MULTISPECIES: thioesterase family protein [Desulfurella]PMP90833.1 MAG: acyl-CoA thioesterase [Desulfurella sp.]SDC95582.1 acyl-CoA thioester hydrolase [Desulfurella multipotens]HEX13113.1 acyl-CoA thioesterase [Desulfurella acetivorans]